ncbi:MULTISPECIES: molybdenum cofactor biosynthesis protein MoaE [Sphingobium]|uniref:Molybdopterin synthase catalytic subunit n=2 Tax=Sphingobium cupriresistens TaxID=1132417 RepID=A0A0J7Y208_9SPHN|nr:MULTISPECIES: molybdenum cofactor biosynthesis protein MoaE [Sphingobium]KMS57463.1 molybdenum cofactor biosynthesis protein MoaE [Sphingobium cupriresistens LL01]MBJ7377511.1 molybdenum cofactor biosynthesis protein MoaE [Sphingobium sp.]RYM14970.1 molybdenum cofactor biosynthesis protein MoaE [Sphingobium cupriresistens]WCP14551.1 Molybdopterin synthase catalytic subunit [Sphingobium sp. AntQ-1]
MKRIAIQTADFDVAAELAALEALGGGGVASFTGIVRGEEGGLIALELEHYPAMTQAQVDRIVEEALARWPLLGVSVIHRFGRLEPGARIVFVGTASRHRAAALESCAFLIDWMKSDAPFWKKEHFGDGATQWVEARAEDEAKAQGWRS